MRAASLCLLFAACASVDQLGSSAGFEDFVGDWSGSLQRPDGEAIAMSLQVEPVAGDANRFHWRLRYGGEEVRDHTLVVRDRSRGVAAFDENNGIVLPVQLRDAELISVFEVGGSVLNVRYRRERDGLRVCVDSYSEGASEPAGQQVRAWPKIAVQRGWLTAR